MAQTPEGKIKTKLRRKLKDLPVWVYIPQAGAFGKAGVPDILVLANGKLFGLECKADEKKKPTDIQTRTMQLMTEHGAHCLVVYDDITIDQAITYIKAAL
jgi:hypothetical protein